MEGELIYGQLVYVQVEQELFLVRCMVAAFLLTCHCLSIIAGDDKAVCYTMCLNRGAVQEITWGRIQKQSSWYR